MGWLGRKRKHDEETVEEVPAEPQEPPKPVLNLLVPDVAGATSYHLHQFYSAEEARSYIEALPLTSGLHAFWGLHGPPAGHVSGGGTGESMVLIRSAEDSDVVYVVSFVDLDSANAFARFEAKRGMGLGLLLIYWAELVEIEVNESGVRLTPEEPPRPAPRVPASPFAGQPSQAEPEATLKPEPVAQVEPEVAASEPEPVAQVEPNVAASEPEPVAQVEPDVAASEPEPVAQVEPEVAASEPEPVAPVQPEAATPEPEPVPQTEPAVPAPRPEPVAQAEPGAVIVEPRHEAVTSEPPRVFEVQLRRAAREPEPAVEQVPSPEPEPVAHQEEEPVLEPPPPLFAADAKEPAKEEIDIEREAIAFLRASTNGTEAAQPAEGSIHMEAEPAQAGNVIYEEPGIVANGAPFETPTEFADAPAPVRSWEPSPADEDGGDDGETSDQRVREVEKILKVKRWDKKDSPFRGFDSPPGRF